ncbi:hypothetical protein E4U21_006211, partial [Claviceps maximensis]
MAGGKPACVVFDSFLAPMLSQIVRAWGPKKATRRRLTPSAWPAMQSGEGNGEARPGIAARRFGLI